MTLIFLFCCFPSLSRSEWVPKLLLGFWSRSDIFKLSFWLISGVKYEFLFPASSFEQALMAMPAPDFSLCLFLIPERVVWFLFLFFFPAKIGSMLRVIIYTSFYKFTITLNQRSRVFLFYGFRFVPLSPW